MNLKCIWPQAAGCLTHPARLVGAAGQLRDNWSVDIHYGNGT